MFGRERGGGAGVGEHRRHAAHVAISGGAFQQGGEVGRLDLERTVEPGNGGGEAVLAAGEFAAKDQRVAMIGIGRDRPVGGEQRRAEIADRAAEASNVEPGEGVLGVRRDRPVEPAHRQQPVAAPQMGKGDHARGVRGVLRRGRLGFADGAVRIVLEQAGVGLEVARLGRGGARAARRGEFGFGRHRIALLQHDPRLQQPGLFVVRLALERALERDPRFAHAALLPGGGACLILLLRAPGEEAGAARKEEQEEERRPRPVIPAKAGSSLLSRSQGEEGEERFQLSQE